MEKIIANKEYTALLRDRRFQLMGGLIALLLLVAVAGGYVSYRTLKKERELAQKEARQTWLNQGAKNPHSAAHFGSFAFRPKSELSFFDFGVDSFVGTNIQLEAHRQNDARFAAAQDSSSLLRFGEMTVAFVLQLLVPLLIIFLCFDAISKEREDFTLSLMLSQGVHTSQVAWGKIRGYAKALSWIVVPALVLVLGLMIVGTDGALTVGLALRFGITLAAYLLYFFFFITVSVIISAYSASSRNSLLKLLSLWIFVCVILPKATANVGATIFRAPSGFEFREAIKKDEENGIDGHNPTDKRFEALKKELMAKYKVDSVEQMPINFDAVAMQEGEKYSSMVYNQHFENLETIYQQQNAVSAYSSLLNPYMAVRNLSMGLAGSDYKTALDFQKQAETYRFSMVELLNNHMRDFSKTGDWDKTADPEIYARLPDFEYQNPSIGQVLGQNQAGLLSLLVWTVILGTAINGLKNKKLF